MKGKGGSIEMIVLFTVLRLLAILIVSHDMSGLLKTWKSKVYFIIGSLLLSLFVGGITGSLLALLFCHLFLNKTSSREKNSFLFTFLPWVFVEVTSKLLQLYFFPWIFQINYLQVKDTPVLIALSYLLVYPIFHLIVKVFFIDFSALDIMGNNHTYQVRQRLLVGVTLAYIILSLVIFYASNVFPYMGLFIYLAGSITVVYSILFILLFAQLNIYSKRRVKDQLAEEMIRHEESLEEYSHRLEKLYNDISQVKKDYLEGLKNMEDSIQRRDLPALKQEYAELLEKSGNSLTLSNYELSRLINLEITSLKSLFSAKVLEAENLGIKVNLELPDVISSTQIEALDLVVISSVFLNNAIEATVKSEDPTLTISFFKNQDYLTLVIDNTTREERIPVSRIFDEGVSSKGEGRGLGLSKVAEILNHYPKVNLETRSCDYHFTQVLSFRDN